VIDLHNIRVLQRRRRLRLTLKTGHKLRISTIGLAQNLYRYNAICTQITPAIDCRHPTTTNRVLYLVSLTQNVDLHISPHCKNDNSCSPFLSNAPRGHVTNHKNASSSEELEA